jgi:hypothetical protein
MSEKGANIDLLFRNGLKDYEVLPPPNVWEGVSSAVKTTPHRLPYVRVAAAVFLLAGLSYTTYRLSIQVPQTSQIDEIALYQPLVRNDLKVNTHRLQKTNLAISTGIDQANQEVIEPVFTETQFSDDGFVPASQVTKIEDVRSVQILKNNRSRNLLTGSNVINKPADVRLVYDNFSYMPPAEDPKPVNRWSIAAMASPTYYSGIASTKDALSSQIISSEQPLFSYSGGVSFSYKLSKRVSIQSGLFYSSLGQKVDGINSYSGFRQYDYTKGDHNFEVLTSNGTVFTSNPDVFLSSNNSERIQTAYTKDVFDPMKASLQPISSSLNQNFSYLEFPVIVRYKLIDKTLGVNLIGGLSYNVLVHNTVSTTYNGGTYNVGDTKGLNPLSVSSSLGMGMEYNLSGKLSLNLEPTFRYYLNPFSISSNSYIHPYSFGVFSGVTYRF